MKSEAIKTLVEFVHKRLDSATIQEQIVVFQALAQIAPSEPERRKASEIAWLLSRASAMQLDFVGALFKDTTP